MLCDLIWNHFLLIIRKTVTGNWKVFVFNNWTGVRGSRKDCLVQGKENGFRMDIISQSHDDSATFPNETVFQI